MSASPSTVRPRVLFVDDDRLIRTAYERQLRGRINAVTAGSGDEALAALSAGPPFAAVVTDLQMPGMDGLSLLGRVRDQSPDTVRVLFTGKADLRVAAQAVNDVGVFRILLKPCPPAQLWECLESAVEAFARNRSTSAAQAAEAAEAVALLQLLMRDTHPLLYARAERLRLYVRHMCVALALVPSERFELAASLSGLGLLATDRGTLDRFIVDRPGDDAERVQFAASWQQAAAIISEVAVLRDVAMMVAAAPQAPQRELVSDATVLGAQLLRTAALVDGFLARGLSRGEMLEALKRDALAPLRLLAGLMNLSCVSSRASVHEREADALEPGMVLEDAVCARGGLKLVPAGRALTPALIQLILGYARTVGIVEPLRVRVTTLQPLTL